MGSLSYFSLYCIVLQAVQNTLARTRRKALPFSLWVPHIVVWRSGLAESWSSRSWLHIFLHKGSRLLPVIFLHTLARASTQWWPERSHCCVAAVTARCRVSPPCSKMQDLEVTVTVALVEVVTEAHPVASGQMGSLPPVTGRNVRITL